MGSKGKTTFLKVLLVVAAVFASSAQAESVVRVGGAGSGLGAMKILAGAYEKAHPGVRIQLFPSLGSSGGIKALLTGALDLAISARPLKREERKAGAVQREYARTPLLFAANNSVRKADLTTRELEKIYLGQMLTWPDGSQIRLVLRPDGDTDTQIVKGISAAMERAVKAAAARPGMILAVTSQECSDTLANVSGALGPSTLTEIIAERRSPQVLSYNGVRPTLKALADGSYPLVKPHYLVTMSKTPAAAQQFALFVATAQGRALLAKTGNLVLPAGKGH